MYKVCLCVSITQIFTMHREWRGRVIDLQNKIAGKKQGVVPGMALPTPNQAGEARQLQRR